MNAICKKYIWSTPDIFSPKQFKKIWSTPDIFLNRLALGLSRDHEVNLKGDPQGDP